MELDRAYVAMDVRCSVPMIRSLSKEIFMATFFSILAVIALGVFAGWNVFRKSSSTGSGGGCSGGCSGCSGCGSFQAKEEQGS